MIIFRAKKVSLQNKSRMSVSTSSVMHTPTKDLKLKPYIFDSSVVFEKVWSPVGTLSGELRF